MSEIKLNMRYPESRLEDITDAYMRGFEVGRAMRADENEKLRELLRDYEELAAALCDARECDGCPFGSEQTICEHMRLIARVGELVVDA